MTPADLLNLPGVTLGPTVAEGMAKLQATKPKTPAVAETLPPIQPPRMRIILDLPGVIVKSEANLGGKVRAKMARKSAVRALLMSGLVPLSAEVVEAIRNDEPETIDAEELATSKPAVDAPWKQIPDMASPADSDSDIDGDAVPAERVERSESPAKPAAKSTTPAASEDLEGM